MSEAEMNSYRLTSMEEPGDERMAQFMREVAEDAPESSPRGAERVAAGILKFYNLDAIISGGYLNHN